MPNSHLEQQDKEKLEEALRALKKQYDLHQDHPIIGGHLLLKIEALRKKLKQRA